MGDFAAPQEFLFLYVTFYLGIHVPKTLIIMSKVPMSSPCRKESIKRGYGKGKPMGSFSQAMEKSWHYCGSLGGWMDICVCLDLLGYVVMATEYI